MSDRIEKTSEVDIIELLLLLWSKRKRIVINCSIAAVLAVIAAFSIPKEYTSTVVMAPEMSPSGGVSGSLGDMASLVGINLGGLAGGDDAFYPELYPQIVASTPFLLDVLSTPVESMDGEIKATLYDYISSHTRTPWWVKIYTVPIDFLKRIIIGVEPDTVSVTSDMAYDMKLTRKQFGALNKLGKLIAVSVDKGNNVITINVTMQDQKIAAHIANVVSEKLTEYIEDYRSAKSRKDLQYSEKLYEEFKQKYIESQKKYAEYANLHQNVVNQKYQIELDRLSNEMDLAFNVYSQMAQTVEMARAKVQENTPVCVVIEPAYIQIKASSPKKIMMLLLWVFMAFFGTSAWIIVKDRIVNR